MLTFSRSNLPDSIKVGYLNCEVRVHVPNHLICYRCQRYDHFTPTYKEKLTWSRCGEQEHEDYMKRTKPKNLQTARGRTKLIGEGVNRGDFRRRYKTIRAREGMVL